MGTTERIQKKLRLASRQQFSTFLQEPSTEPRQWESLTYSDIIRRTSKGNRLKVDSGFPQPVKDTY